MYFMETIPTNHPHEMFELFCRIARQRAKDYSSVIKVVTELRYVLPTCALRARKSSLDRGTRCIVSPLLPARKAEFAYGLSYLRSKGLFDAADQINVVFKQASTLSSLIALAIRMQYRTIVLCGVDLNNSEYFYQDAVLYPETASIEFSPRLSASCHQLANALAHNDRIGHPGDETPASRSGGNPAVCREPFLGALAEDY